MSLAPCKRHLDTTHTLNKDLPFHRSVELCEHDLLFLCLAMNRPGVPTAPSGAVGLRTAVGWQLEFSDLQVYQRKTKRKEIQSIVNPISMP